MFLFTSPLSIAIAVVFSSGILGIIIAGICCTFVHVHTTGSAQLTQDGTRVRSASATVIATQATVLTLLVCSVAALIYIGLDMSLVERKTMQWQVPYQAASFLVGALCAALTVSLSILIATKATPRVAQAARTSLHASLRTAFFGSGAAGMITASLLVLCLTGGLLFLLNGAELSLAQSLTALVSFTFGISIVAFFSRIGGGILAKSADIAAWAIGESDVALSEHDRNNPLSIANSTGDIVGNIAGVGADLLESAAIALTGAMLLGLRDDGWGSFQEEAVLLPLFLAGFGIVSCAIGIVFVHIRKGKSNVEQALRSGVLLTTFLFLCGAFLLCWRLPAEKIWPLFIIIVTGQIIGLIIGYLTEYYTSKDFPPVQHLSEAGTISPATNIIGGMALGQLSAFTPLLFLGVAVLIAMEQGGLYGIALLSVSMLSSLGITVAINTYGPIADNANGFAHTSGLPKQVRARTNRLDAAGSTAAAIGKGAAITAATLTVLTLIGTFAEATGVRGMHLLDPPTLIGLLLGTTVPYGITGLTLQAVRHLSESMVHRAQEDTIPEGEKDAVLVMTKKHLAHGTKVTLRALILPASIVTLAPLVIGFLFGPSGLGGFLTGALLSGVLLAVSLTNSGGAWDSGKQYFLETHGDDKDAAHAAASIGDTVGDPLKDAAGPAINVALKCMCVLSLLTAGLYAGGGFF